MKSLINMIILWILAVSLSMNIFLWSNNEVSCDNIDSRRKADILYFMWHRDLDWDKDWVPCENLPYNQE